MQALVILAHPDPGSLNHALARALADAWAGLGCDAALRDLHAEGFCPVMTAAEMRGAPSDDPRVRDHVAALGRADLLGIVHPNQWGAPPAMMKGWMDRVLAPGAAYALPKGEGGEAVGLLRARAAVVLNTGNTAPAREAARFGDPLDRTWRDCTLAFCGVPRVTRRLFAVVAASTPAERASWLAEAAALARGAHALARGA